MYDNRLEVDGKGVSKVGDDDQDGGGQKGGEQAARQRPGELEDHLYARLLALEWVRDAFRNKNGIIWEKFPRWQTPPLPQYENFFNEIPFFF